MEWTENSISAHTRAIELGSDCIETDLQLTADGYIICMHEPCIDIPKHEEGRTCSVSDLTLEEILTASVTSCPIATLQELLQLDRGGVGLFLELKPECLQPKRIICAVLSQLELFNGWGSSEIYMGSFSLDIKRELCLSIHPQRRVGLAHFEGDFLPQLTMQPGTMAVHDHLLTAGRIEMMRKEGIEIWAWPVNDAVRAKELVVQGISGIITDDPKLMFEAFV